VRTHVKYRKTKFCIKGLQQPPKVPIVLKVPNSDVDLHYKRATMNTNLLTNPTIKAAFEAWQKGDIKTWLSFFAEDVKLFDDGNPRSFHNFSHEAIGHERFTSIDKVENNGLDVYGQFHSEQWGDFKTYFKFQLNNDGKITRLDIGQVNY